MSDHKKPMTPELRQALINHGHPTDTPSQLADSFRHGWLAALAAQPAKVPEGFVLVPREMTQAMREAISCWRNLLPEETWEHVLAAAAPKPEQKEAPELTDDEIVGAYEVAMTQHLRPQDRGGVLRVCRAVIAADRARRK